MVVEPQFTIRIESRNGVTSVALVGELDLATVPILEEHLTHLERGDVIAIVLDLRELAFVDCSGLRAFLVARDHAETNGHRLIVVGAGSQARRLLALTGTEFLLDEREAVSVLDQFTGRGKRRVGRAEVSRSSVDD